MSALIPLGIGQLQMSNLGNSGSLFSALPSRMEYRLSGVAIGSFPTTPPTTNLGEIPDALDIRDALDGGG